MKNNPKTLAEAQVMLAAAENEEKRLDNELTLAVMNEALAAGREDTKGSAAPRDCLSS